LVEAVEVYFDRPYWYLWISSREEKEGVALSVEDEMVLDRGQSDRRGTVERDEGVDLVTRWVKVTPARFIL
jgi:hypothetical protein